MRESREPRERSVSLDFKISVSQDSDSSNYLDTRCEVVWPTTPLEKRGGISMEREDPKEEEESLRALLLPSPTLVLLLLVSSQQFSKLSLQIRHLVSWSVSHSAQPGQLSLAY